jgi:hypothetical protein
VSALVACMVSLNASVVVVINSVEDNAMTVLVSSDLNTVVVVVVTSSVVVVFLVSVDSNAVNVMALPFVNSFFSPVSTARSLVETV